MGPLPPRLLARPVVPHPSHPYPLTLPRDAIVPSPRSSSRPTASHRPSPRLIDTISGEASFAPAWRGHPISERCSVSSSPVAAGVICLSCLFAPVLPFVSARHGIVPLPLPPSSSHRRFSHPACLPRPSISESIGACRLCGCFSFPSARLPVCAVASYSHPPRLIDTGNGEDGGASFSCLSGLSRSRRVRLSIRLRRMWDGGDFILRPAALDCLD